jgi:hypothetical protein
MIILLKTVSISVGHSLGTEIAGIYSRQAYRNDGLMVKSEEGMSFKSIICATCACLAVLSFSVNAAVVEIESNTVSIVFVETEFSGVYGDAIPIDIEYSMDDGEPTTTDWFREWTITLRDSSGVAYDFNSASAAIEDLENYLWTSTVYFPQPGNYTIDLFFGTYHLPGGAPGCGPNSGTCWNEHFDDILENGEHALMNVHLSAVPIPATAWLFGSGLIGLIGLARRKV